MRKNSKVILAAAAMAGIPAIAKASVTETYTIDPTIYVATSPSGTYTALTDSSSAGTATNPVFDTANNTVYIPTGDSIKYGYDVYMPAATTATGHPATGVLAAAFGVANSNSSIGLFAGGTKTGTGSTTLNPTFPTGWNSNGTPQGDGSGGLIYSLGISGAVPAGSVSSYMTNFGSTTSEIVSNLEFDTSTAGTDVLTPDLNPTTKTTINKYGSFGVDSAGVNYTLTSTGSTPDVISTSGAVLNIVTLSGTPPTNHAIISLTSSTPSGYGSSPDGSLTLQPIAPGSYPVATDSTFTTATTAYVSVSGFDSGDTEIYALKLNVSGGTPTTTQLNQIISDITSGTTGGTAAAGVTASLVTGIYSTLFPGYNLLLTTTSGPNPADTDLAFDFSSAADSDSALGPVTVAGVAAVPEPATAAGVVLGAAGLLLGRRRKLTQLA
jgi:hypothetical protein